MAYVQFDMWHAWANRHVTLGVLWLVVEVPRGPMMGCHMAPRDWLLALYVKLYGMAGGRTRRPPRWAKDWQGRANRPPYGCCL
jgi:hypothetical protein